MRWMLALAAIALTFVALPGQAAPDGTGVTVAILDSGVDASHSELTGRVTRTSYWDPSLPAGLPVDLPLASDPDGQGTAVASLVAGRTLGLAPAARILDLQVSAQYTGGVADPATEANAIRALDDLLTQPSRAQVVVLSFAQAGLSADGAATIAQQAQGLWEKGVLVVVPTSASPNALSSSPSVVTVAGTEACPAAFTSANLKPDVAAKSNALSAATPGDGVQPGGTGQVSGTAYAAAQAAGALAQLRSGFPDLPADAAAAYLRDSAADLGAPGPDGCSGFGAIDPDSAVMWAAQWKDPLASSGKQDTPLPTVLMLAPLAAAALLRRRA